MQALTLARQRLRARIQHPSTPEPVRLAHGLLESGQSRYLPILSSPLAQEILARGYEARTLEKIYANRVTDQSLVGQIADRMILDLPLHSALRERFEATVGEICAAAVMAQRAGAPEFRLLCAPCGVGSELLGAAVRLRRERPETFATLRCWGVDPDADGHFLPEARRRAAAADVNAEFLREDLRRFRSVDAVVDQQGPFHLINCVGASQTRSVEELGVLVERYSRALAPGGTLLIDRWQPASRSVLTADLGLQMPYHNVRAFQAMLATHGLTIEREHPTGEGGNVLLVARKSG
jgi:SAM-dependent methyltransferase